MNVHAADPGTTKFFCKFFLCNPVSGHLSSAAFESWLLPVVYMCILLTSRGWAAPSYLRGMKNLPGRLLLGHGDMEQKSG